MRYFNYSDGELHCEDVPVGRIARRVGTPVYIYSAATITCNYQRLAACFRGVPHTICYSVKANSNLTVLRELAGLGAGFDIVSGGELHRVLRAGGDPGKIVFSGVGKTREEIDYALRQDVLFLNVESPAELEMIAARARHLTRPARIAVRINPDVEPHTHRHISTGKRTHKFGVHWREALSICQRATELAGIEFVGIGCHIGSQITSVSPFVEALHRLEELAGSLRGAGVQIRYLDFGGGIGIRYQQEKPVSPATYARPLKQAARRLGCHIILEPGRLVVGSAGILLTSVILEKKVAQQRFVVVDAAMNDFLRPALYGATHRILPVVRHRSARPSPADVVGPVCETADCFGRGISLPPLAAGQFLALMDVGAYGFVLASSYNSRPRPAEVLVRGNRFQVIRQRETWRDLIRGER